MLRPSASRPLTLLVSSSLHGLAMETKFARPDRTAQFRSRPKGHEADPESRAKAVMIDRIAGASSHNPHSFGRWCWRHCPRPCRKCLEGDLGQCARIGSDDRLASTPGAEAYGRLAAHIFKRCRWHLMASAAIDALSNLREVDHLSQRNSHRGIARETRLTAVAGRRLATRPSCPGAPAPE